MPPVAAARLRAPAREPAEKSRGLIALPDPVHFAMRAAAQPGFGVASKLQSVRDTTATCASAQSAFCDGVRVDSVESRGLEFSHLAAMRTALPPSAARDVGRPPALSWPAGSAPLSLFP